MHEERDQFLERLRAKTGAWPDFEGILRDIYVAYLQKGARAVDVGVNEGHHLVQIAERVGATGHVVGIEACPPLYAGTLGNLQRLYPQLLDRIEFHNIAVSNQPGALDFFYDKTHSGLSGLRNRDVINGHDVEKFVVPVTTLDLLVVGPVDFVKIDIEGAEYDALRGAKAMLQSKPLVAFEFDHLSPGIFGFQTSDLVNLLTANGYQIFDLFGYPHPTAEDLSQAPTWNFLAVPAHIDVDALCAPARRGR